MFLFPFPLHFVPGSRGVWRFHDDLWLNDLFLDLLLDAQWAPIEVQRARPHLMGGFVVKEESVCTPVNKQLLRDPPAAYRLGAPLWGLPTGCPHCKQSEC